MSCGCINLDCSHRVVATTTSSTTTTLCPDAITNDSVYPGECVVYTGGDSQCFTISSGDNIFAVLYQLLLLFDASCTTTTTTTTIPITTTSTTTTTTRPPRTTTTTSTTLRPTTTTTTSTTSTSTTSTTTVDPKFVNTTVYLVCCTGYPFTNSVPAIVLPYTLPTNITITPNNIYYETDGLTINTTWVAGLLSDIQGLGYSGATVTYQPNFNNFTESIDNTVSGVPFINAIAACAATPNQSTFLPLLCPEVNPNLSTSTTTLNPDLTTSTTSTSTTTQAPTTSTTSTTTTEVPIFLRTCAPLYNDGNGNIYSYEVGTNTSQFVFASGYSYLDIAHTETKLWLPTPTSIVEYDITLSPFTIIPGKSISFPAGFIPSLGLAAVSNDTVISVNERTNPGIVSEINTLNGVVTPKFNLISGRKVSGDFMLTSTGKFIVTSQVTFGSTFPQTFYFISQYDYATGKLEVDIDISSTINKAWGIFEDGGEIFIMSNDGGVYTIGKDFPYAITFVSNTGNTLRGASQPIACLTDELIITSTTTSTTTTLVPTTTTTSTSTTTTSTTTTSTSTTTTTDFPPPSALCVNTNVGFNTDLSGWEVSKNAPPSATTTDWIWVAGRAAYNGGTTGGYISQNVLTVGFTYRITLDLEIINSGFLFNKSIRVYAGTTASAIINTIGLTAVDVTLTCATNGYLAIYGIDSIDAAGAPYYMFIDNVCAEQTIPPPTTTTSTSTTSTSTTSTTTAAPTTTSTTSTTTTLAPTTTSTTSTTTLAPTTTTTSTTTTSTTTLEPTTTTTTILLDCVILGILSDTTTTTTTLVPTTTTSTTSTTTTIQNFVVCPDCIPILSNVTANGIGLLSVGNMTSATCTLGDYVIDWYLDSTSGSIQFTSGNTGNTDPAIQQFHPFTGAGARPSIGGSWIPVIRYAYFDSIKYTSQITPGAAYASDLATCLAPITVLDLNCTNGTNTTVGFTQYSHKFAYTNGSQVASDASKSLVFTLNSDGTTKYFAWYFQGVIISDRIKFTYVSPTNSTSTLLQDFVIGTDLPATDFTGVTKKVDQDNFRYIIDLTTTTYTTGDYILIDIIAGYIDPNNSNTNWVAYFKCLTTFDPSWTPALRVPCSATITSSPTECLNTISINISNLVDKTPTDIYKYLSGPQVIAGTGGASPANPYATDNLSYNKYNCSTDSVDCGSINQAITCIQATGTITYSRTNNVHTVVYTNDADYNRSLNAYNAAQVSLSATYSTDPTIINHYKLYRFNFAKRNADSCGDTAIRSITVSFNYESTVVFDPATRTLTITAVSKDASPFYATLPTNGCRGNCGSLTIVNQGNSSAGNAIVAPITSGTDYDYPIGGYGYCEGTAVVANSQIYSKYTYYLPYYPVTPIPLANNWASELSSGNRIAAYFDYKLYTIIDNTADAPNNFHMYDYFPPYTPVYTIANGVVTVPITGCGGTTTTTSTTTTTTSTTSTTTTTTEAPPVLAWRAATLACETDTQFAIIKQVTGVSTPQYVWYDETLNRVWVADGDNFTKGNVYWFNPATATTEADVTYYAGIKANSLYYSYIDTVYRRIYFFGTDTANFTQLGGSGVITGLVVYDMDTNSHYQVSYGDNYPFHRMINFVTANYIYGNDYATASFVRFDRANPLNTPTYKSYASTGQSAYFTRGAQQMIEVGDKIWVAAGPGGNNTLGSIGIFDTDLNFITSITLPGVVVVPSSRYGSDYYWQTGFFDVVNNLFYVTDFGSNNYYVIAVNGTYSGGTVTTTSLTYLLEDKALHSSSFSIDPIVGKLYISISIFDQIGVSPIIPKSYEINRTTGTFVNFFNRIGIGNLVPVDDGVHTNSVMGVFGGNVGWSVPYPNSAYSDGIITIYNNSLFGDNTGIVDVLTLEQYNENNGVPTGVTKDNVYGDPDYIAPYFDIVECPITYTVQCADVTYRSTGDTTVYYEFGIINTTKLNPDIATIQVSVYRSSDNGLITSSNIDAPFTSVYYNGTFTLPANSYYVTVDYYDASNNLLTCTAP